MMRSLSLVLAILVLASCGGGSSVPSTSSAAIGKRVVPGYTLSAEHLSAMQPGQPCIVRVTVTPDAGQSAVASIEVWLGTSTYDPSPVVTAAVAVWDQAGVYDVTVNLPATLAADATVWVRLTAVDGMVIEAGRDAFPLAAR